MDHKEDDKHGYLIEHIDVFIDGMIERKRQGVFSLIWREGLASLIGTPRPRPTLVGRDTQRSDDPDPSAPGE